MSDHSQNKKQHSSQSNQHKAGSSEQQHQFFKFDEHSKQKNDQSSSQRASGPGNPPTLNLNHTNTTSQASHPKGIQNFGPLDLVLNAKNKLKNSGGEGGIMLDSQLDQPLSPSSMIANSQDKNQDKNEKGKSGTSKPQNQTALTGAPTHIGMTIMKYGMLPQQQQDSNKQEVQKQLKMEVKDITQDDLKNNYFAKMFDQEIVDNLQKVLVGGSVSNAQPTSPNSITEQNMTQKNMGALLSQKSFTNGTLNTLIQQITNSQSDLISQQPLSTPGHNSRPITFMPRKIEVTIRFPSTILVQHLELQLKSQSIFRKYLRLLKVTKLQTDGSDVSCYDNQNPDKSRNSSKNSDGSPNDILSPKGGYYDQKQKIIEANVLGVCSGVKLCFMFCGQELKRGVSQYGMPLPSKRSSQKRLGRQGRASGNQNEGNNGQGTQRSDASLNGGKIEVPQYIAEYSCSSDEEDSDSDDMDELDDEVAMISKKNKTKFNQIAGGNSSQDSEEKRGKDEYIPNQNNIKSDSLTLKTHQVNQIDLENIQIKFNDEDLDSDDLHDNHMYLNQKQAKDQNTNFEPQVKLLNKQLDNLSASHQSHSQKQLSSQQFQHSQPKLDSQSNSKTRSQECFANLSHPSAQNGHHPQKSHKDTARTQEYESKSTRIERQRIFTQENSENWHQKLIQECIESVKITGFDVYKVPAVTNLTNLMNDAFFLRKEDQERDMQEVDFMVGVLMITTKRQTQASEIFRRIQTQCLDKIEKDANRMDESYLQQLFVKCALMEMLVAESMCQSIQVNDKLLAMSRMIDLSIGKLVPKMTFQPQLPTYEDSYTHTMANLPLLIKFCLVSMTHKCEIIKISALKLIEFILETQGCSLDSSMLIILRQLLEIFPKKTNSQSKDQKSQDQSIKINEASFKSTDTDKDKLKLQDLSLNLNGTQKSESFAPQSQHYDTPLSLIQPASGSGSAVKNLFNHILETYISVLSSISSHILHLIFYEVIIPTLCDDIPEAILQMQPAELESAEESKKFEIYGQAKNAEIKIFCVKIAEKIITICQGDLVFSKRVLDILIKQSTISKQQSANHLTNEQMQYQTCIKNMWQSTRQKVFTNYSCKFMNTLIEWLLEKLNYLAICGEQRVISQEKQKRKAQLEKAEKDKKSTEYQIQQLKNQIDSEVQVDISLIELTEDQTLQLSQLCDVITLISLGKRKNEEEANSLIKIRQTFSIELYFLINPLIFWLKFSVQREDRLPLFKQIYQTLKDILENLPPKSVDFDLMQIVIPILQRTSDFLKNNSPSLQMLKFLEIILRDIKAGNYIQQNPDLQYFFLELFGNFVNHVSYNLYEEVFSVFDKLLDMCHDIMTEKILKRCIIALVDKYTIKSKAHKQSIQNFMRSLMEVKVRQHNRQSSKGGGKDKAAKKQDPSGSNYLDQVIEMDQADHMHDDHMGDDGEDQISIHSKNNYFEIMTDFCFFFNEDPAGQKMADPTKGQNSSLHDSFKNDESMEFRQPVDLHDLYIDKLQFFIDSLSLMNEFHIHIFTSLISHQLFKQILFNLLQHGETSVRLKCHEILEVLTNYFVQYQIHKSVYEIPVAHQQQSSSYRGDSGDLLGGQSAHKKKPMQVDIIEVDFINHERLLLSQIVIQCVQYSLDQEKDSYLQFNSLILLDFLFQNLLPVPTFTNEQWKIRQQYKKKQQSLLSQKEEEALQEAKVTPLEKAMDISSIVINQRTPEFEVTDIPYLCMRLKLIFKLWPFIKRALNSAWSNIRSICYGLICSMLKIDIRDFKQANTQSDNSQNTVQNAQQKQAITYHQKLKDIVIPMLNSLLSSKESESKAGGLNILGSFCGLSYDFSKVKITNNFDFFKKNSQFVTNQIWQLVFDLQDDWDITIKEASVVLIQLCAPRDSINFFNKVKMEKEIGKYQAMTQQLHINYKSNLIEEMHDTKLGIKNYDFKLLHFNSINSSSNQSANNQEKMLKQSFNSLQLQQTNAMNDSKLYENHIRQLAYIQSYFFQPQAASQDGQVRNNLVASQEQLNKLYNIDAQLNTNLFKQSFSQSHHQQNPHQVNQNNLSMSSNGAHSLSGHQMEQYSTINKNYNEQLNEELEIQIAEYKQQKGSQENKQYKFHFFVDEYADDQIQEIISIFRNDFKPPKNLWIERNQQNSTFNSPDYFADIYSAAIEQFNQQQQQLQHQQNVSMQNTVNAGSSLSNISSGSASANHKAKNQSLTDALEDQIILKSTLLMQQKQEKQKNQSQQNDLDIQKNMDDNSEKQQKLSDENDLSKTLKKGMLDENVLQGGALETNKGENTTNMFEREDHHPGSKDGQKEEEGTRTKQTELQDRIESEKLQQNQQEMSSQKGVVGSQDDMIKIKNSNHNNQVAQSQQQFQQENNQLPLSNQNSNEMLIEYNSHDHQTQQQEGQVRLKDKDEIDLSHILPKDNDMQRANIETGNMAHRAHNYLANPAAGGSEHVHRDASRYASEYGQKMSQQSQQNQGNNKLAIEQIDFDDIVINQDDIVGKQLQQEQFNTRPAVQQQQQQQQHQNLFENEKLSSTNNTGTQGTMPFNQNQLSNSHQNYSATNSGYPLANTQAHSNQASSSNAQQMYLSPMYDCQNYPQQMQQQPLQQSAQLGSNTLQTQLQAQPLAAQSTAHQAHKHKVPNLSEKLQNTVHAQAGNMPQQQLVIKDDKKLTKQAQQNLNEMSKGYISNIDNMNLIKQINNCFKELTEVQQAQQKPEFTGAQQQAYREPKGHSVGYSQSGIPGTQQQQQHKKLNKSFENLMAANKLLISSKENTNHSHLVGTSIPKEFRNKYIQKKNLSNSPKRNSGSSGRKHGSKHHYDKYKKKHGQHSNALESNRSANTNAVNNNPKAMNNLRDLNYFIKTIEKDLTSKFNKLNMKDFNSVPTTPTSILKKVENHVKALVSLNNEEKAYMSNTCPNIAQLLQSLEAKNLTERNAQGGASNSSGQSGVNNLLKNNLAGGNSNQNVNPLRLKNFNKIIQKNDGQSQGSQNTPSNQSNPQAYSQLNFNASPTNINKIMLKDPSSLMNNQPSHTQRLNLKDDTKNNIMLTQQQTGSRLYTQRERSAENAHKKIKFSPPKFGSSGSGANNGKIDSQGPLYANLLKTKKDQYLFQQPPGSSRLRGKTPGGNLLNPNSKQNLLLTGNTLNAILQQSGGNINSSQTPQTTNQKPSNENSYQTQNVGKAKKHVGASKGSLNKSANVIKSHREHNSGQQANYGNNPLQLLENNYMQPGKNTDHSKKSSQNHGAAQGQQMTGGIDLKKQNSQRQSSTNQHHSGKGGKKEKLNKSVGNANFLNIPQPGDQAQLKSQKGYHQKIQQQNTFSPTQNNLQVGGVSAAAASSQHKEYLKKSGKHGVTNNLESQSTVLQTPNTMAHGSSTTHSKQGYQSKSNNTGKSKKQYANAAGALGSTPQGGIDFMSQVVAYSQNKTLQNTGGTSQNYVTGGNQQYQPKTSARSGVSQGSLQFNNQATLNNNVGQQTQQLMRKNKTDILDVSPAGKLNIQNLLGGAGGQAQNSSSQKKQPQNGAQQMSSSEKKAQIINKQFQNFQVYQLSQQHQQQKQMQMQGNSVQQQSSKQNQQQLY